MSASTGTIVTTQEAAAAGLGISVEEFRALREREGFPGQPGAYDVEAIAAWRAGLDPAAERRQMPARDDLPRVERIVLPRVNAGPCPANAMHVNTAVYKTKGRTRFCKCNDCGQTWKVTAEEADPLRTFLEGLADKLEALEAIEAEDTAGEPLLIVCLPDDFRQEVVARLRKLVE